MRPIDADDLMRVIDQKFQKHYGDSVYQFIHDFHTCVLRQIRKAPTIDAVPVVRCEKCDWYCADTGICDFWGEPRHPKHYCDEGLLKKESETA